MPYLDVRGVRSYHETSGEGPPVVLLHGGYCSLEVLRPLSESLATGYRVYAAERPGHGRTPDREGGYSFAESVGDTLAYLDVLGLEDAHLVGYSDGGVIGLLLARDHPERVCSLVAIGVNVDPSGFVSDDLHERAMPAEPMNVIIEQYDALSPDGPEHATVVTEKLHAMYAVEPDLPAESLGAIDVPTLIMAAQHDMVALEHTALIVSSIPGAQLCIVPGASHLLVLERPRLAGQVVREFLDGLGDRRG
ncbi:MAG: alpha/beta hydrolase [Nocardioides sp.]|uniref:alpha/beta fold hydrolase n=1 Tax=Nocardioides sp. TaxID=35761 RepID=UPI0039E6739F